MKKLLSIILLTVLFGCAWTPEQKTKEVVKKYLKENLNDWSSYEPIEWEYYDSMFSMKETSFSLLRSEISLMKAKYESSEIFSDKVTADAQKDSLLVLQRELDSALAHFKPSFEGYRIQHKYRAKDNNGNYRLYNDLFMVYSDYSGAKVIAY
jgi:hypothetical protein